MKIQELKNLIKGLYWIYSSTKGFHRDEMLLQKKYYIQYDFKNVQIPSIVVMIDGRSIHGGLGDRLRGIVTIYGYCKQNNLPFYIHHSFPFKLSDYLVPNLLNWEIEDEKISYDPDKSIPILLNDFQLTTVLHKLYLNKVIKQNKQIHLYTNTFFLDTHFSENFKELFKPSEALQAAIDLNLQAIGTDYVAMVFRFQQLLGDFKEPGYPVLAKKEQTKLIAKCIHKLKNLRTRFHSNEKVLVTSDSLTFLMEADKLDFVYIIPGQVVHIDHTADANFATYMKSFVDMYMLSKAQKVYLLKTDNMYHSGFAERAAMISSTLYEEIIF